MAAAHGTRWLSLVLLPLLCWALDVSADMTQPAGKDEEQALPLPRWSEQDLKRFRHHLPGNASGGVLPSQNGDAISDINELINSPLNLGPRLDHLFNDQDSGLSPRLKMEDMRLFLPEAILSQPAQSQPTAVQQPTSLAALKDVPPEFLAACEKSLPKEYLIDPDQLVPEIENHDMIRLLEFHAQDARIKLYVLMIGRDQKLPEAARLERFASGSLLQSDACLVVYPLGEPWRARLFVSGAVHDQISTEFLSETIQACLHEALQTSNEHDQLRRYTVHLSTRLFWLQKALAPGMAVSKQSGPALTEFNPQLKEPAVTPSPRLNTITIWLLAALLTLLLVIFLRRQILHHLQLKRRRRIWMLSEPETVPRLGGAFTGGGGSMIRYS